MLKIQTLEVMASKENSTEAEAALVRAYHNSQHRYTSETLVINETIWEREYEMFLNTVIGAQIKEIIVTATDTGLMNFIHFLLENGCTVTGAVVVKTVSSKFSPSRELKGMKIKIS